MNPLMKEFGRFLLIFGVVMAALGAVLLLADKMGWQGSLPGDLILRRGRVSVFVPIATSVLLSLLLTLLLNLFLRR